MEVNDQRFVVLVLAAPGTGWVIALTGWTDAGIVPLELVRCGSGEETRARLASGRLFSALVADGALADLDRDLLGAASRSGCPVVVVQGERVRRDWIALGATDVLDPRFGPGDLVEALAECSGPIGGQDATPVRRAAGGLLVAVVGPGGTGASTAATALAQALAASDPGRVVLADFSRCADLGLLHGVPEEASGVQELVDAHRVGVPTDDDVVSLATPVVDGSYRVLPGLRRARHWAAIRPRSFEAALASLTRAFPVVVCDVDPDLEGEDEGGSIDVEERNAMSRITVQSADVVLAVAEPSRKGLHRLARVLEDLRAAGVEESVVVPVLNRVRQPNGPGATSSAPGAVTLPELDLEQTLDAHRRLPAVLGAELVRAVARRTGGGLRSARTAERLRRVQPGALGTVSPDPADTAPPVLQTWADATAATDRQAADRQAADRQAADRQAADRQAAEEAVPEPPPAGGPGAELQAALLDTARHPGIVRLLELSEAGLVLEPVPGRVLGIGELDSLEEVAGVVGALATTVADLHALGIVHGAISAGAVVIGTDGRPVLGAFDHARWIGDDGDVACDLAALGELLASLLEPFDTPVAVEASAVTAPSARMFASALLETVPGARLPGAPPSVTPSARSRSLRRGGRRRRRLEDAAPPRSRGDGPTG
ncbi:MAG: hypothetical protein ACYDAD_02185 [Acidimicrobiales bacterium]